MFIDLSSSAYRLHETLCIITFDHSTCNCSARTTLSIFCSSLKIGSLYLSTIIAVQSSRVIQIIVSFLLYIAAITTAVFTAFYSRKTLLKVSRIAITFAFCAFASVRDISIRLSFITIRFVSVILSIFAFVRFTFFMFVFRTTYIYYSSYCYSCYYYYCYCGCACCYSCTCYFSIFLS